MSRLGLARFRAHLRETASDLMRRVGRRRPDEARQGHQDGNTAACEQLFEDVLNRNRGRFRWRIMIAVDSLGIEQPPEANSITRVHI
jgi:hypothetical protein